MNFSYVTFEDVSLSQKVFKRCIASCRTTQRLQFKGNNISFDSNSSMILPITHFLIGELTFRENLWNDSNDCTIALSCLTALIKELSKSDDFVKNLHKFRYVSHARIFCARSLLGSHGTEIMKISVAEDKTLVEVLKYYGFREGIYSSECIF